ncbi:DNA-3-methyladenine glycosylase 2 family protein [candidate division GN15 bacterium]|nr:DNA-3-methyladenine glycosylase 2 family protein [candidate division GN15 bacterium]
MPAPVDTAKAIRHLRKADPVMKRLIASVGPCTVAPSKTTSFHALCRAICFQQLSGKAATTIFGRVQTLAGQRTLTPTRILELPPAELRAAGLSTSKVAFVRDLATKVADRSLHFPSLVRKPDEQIVERLITVKGIGVWSAQMYLMFVLARPDVFPIDDLGIRNAIARFYNVARADIPARAPAVAEKWRPYRTVASWYLWAGLDQQTPG